MQRQLLTLIETVWHLCEILFIETLPGTISLVKCCFLVQCMCFYYLCPPGIFYEYRPHSVISFIRRGGFASFVGMGTKWSCRQICQGCTPACTTSWEPFLLASCKYHWHSNVIMLIEKIVISHWFTVQFIVFYKNILNHKLGNVQSITCNW